MRGPTGRAGGFRLVIGIDRGAGREAWWAAASLAMADLAERAAALATPRSG